MPIRRANAVDAEAVAAVLRDSFREVEHLYTRAGYAATTPDASVVRERLKEGPTWIAEDAGFPVGTVSAVLRDLDLYLRSMAVTPTARGRRFVQLALGEECHIGIVRRPERIAGAIGTRQNGCRRGTDALYAHFVGAGN